MRSHKQKIRDRKLLCFIFMLFVLFVFAWGGTQLLLPFYKDLRGAIEEQPRGVEKEEPINDISPARIPEEGSFIISYYRGGYNIEGDMDFSNKHFKQPYILPIPSGNKYVVLDTLKDWVKKNPRESFIANVNETQTRVYIFEEITLSY